MNNNTYVDRKYFRQALVCGAVAVPIAFATIIYILAFTKGTDLIWVTLRGLVQGVDQRIFTISVATLGGLLVGVIMRYQNRRKEKSLGDQMQEGHVEYRGLPGLIIGAVVTLSIGASVGPEGPLAHMGGGIASWVSERLRYTVERARILALAGIAAAFGSLFGSPLGSAFMSVEFTSVINFPLYAHLLAAILAATIGDIIFTHVIGTTMAGLYHFNYTVVAWSDVFIAVLLGALGVLMALLFKLINTSIRRLTAPLSKSPILKTTLGGLCFGIVGALLPLTLFSGESQLHTVIDQAAELGVAMLLLLAVVKLIMLSLCLNTGFPGGFIFPVFFAAGTLGLAVHLVVPGIPEGVAFVAVMAGTAAAVTRMPITAMFIIGFLTQPELLPIAIIASLTSFLLVTGLPDAAGDARKALAQTEAPAAPAGT